MLFSRELSLTILSRLLYDFLEVPSAAKMAKNAAKTTSEDVKARNNKMVERRLEKMVNREIITTKNTLFFNSFFL